MKSNLKSLKNNLFFIAVFVFSSSLSFAHFGSKGPFYGSVSCGIVNDTLVYIGTTDGGVFFSTKQTLVGWSAKPVGLKSGKITALAHTGKYLFAATADSGVFVYTGFVGSDRYWNKVSNGLSNLKITSLVALDSITVIAGTAGGGLFKTINKGTTWNTVNAVGINDYDITGIVNVGNRIVHTSGDGIFATDDKGATWIDFNDVNTDQINTSAISYNSTTDEIMIINSVGLYVASSASTTGTPTYISAQTGLPVNTLVRSISNNGTAWFLATDKGVYTSPTGSINWTAANAGLPTNDVNTVIPFQTRLVAGTNKEGIYKTPASAISWIANNTNFNNILTYSMVTSGVAVVVAATEKGVFVSKDLAATYKKSNSGLTDSLNVTDLTFSGTNLFATTKNAGVFMSADTGKTWSSYNVGLTNMAYKKIIASGSVLNLLAMNGEVYEYNGMMSMWMPIQTGLPPNVIPTSLTFYGNKLLLGTYGNGVYIKQLSGGFWSASNTNLANMKVTSVTTSGNKLFAGTDGAGVFVSDTTAISWTATSATSIAHTVTMGLDGNKIQAMAYYAGYIFASYKGGLLATSDNGVTWIAGGNQFNLPSYSDVNKISFVTTRIFVITENNGLYSNALSELPVVTGINTINSSNKGFFVVIPNPNNGTFSINLDNIKGNYIETTVLDVTGKIVDCYKNATQQIVIAQYPKGVYFVRVQTTNEVITQKMIVE